MKNLSGTQKYTLGVLLSWGAQHLLVMICLGWELSWRMPFEILLFSLFFLSKIWPLLLLNGAILIGFIALDGKWKSGGRFPHSLLAAWVVFTTGFFAGALLWYTLVNLLGIDPRSEALNAFEFFDPEGSPMGLFPTFAGNFLFLLFFVPFWHYKLRRWRKAVLFS